MKEEEKAEENEPQETVTEERAGVFDMEKKIVQTAGREQLGEFSPEFAHLNDDILFGEVWNEEAIDVKTRCIITVVSLTASGMDSGQRSV